MFNVWKKQDLLGFNTEQELMDAAGLDLTWKERVRYYWRQVTGRSVKLEDVLSPQDLERINNHLATRDIPANDRMLCEVGCKGLECTHHFDAEKIEERVITLEDGTQFLVTGKRVGELTNYRARPDITAEDIWTDIKERQSRRERRDKAVNEAKED
jgi:hypothetical protein